MGIIICETEEKETSTFFYNIVNKITPINYLYTLIPPTIQSTSVYPLRNGNDIILPFCRLSSTSDSFIPTTIKKYNRLNNNIRNVDTLSKFKSELKKINETENHAVPKHYFYGPRKLNIITSIILEWLVYSSSIILEWQVYSSSIILEWLVYSSSIILEWPVYSSSIILEWQVYSSSIILEWLLYISSIILEWLVYSSNIILEWLVYSSSIILVTGVQF